MLISWFTSQKNTENSFFDGDRKSPWILVAFGMIGSGISAVSLVSIPGNVGNENLYYFQFVLGTILGYLFIVFVLVPVFYSLKLISIYGYLKSRFGETSYLTGSVFFLISQSFGAALRLLLAIKILQSAFFDALGIPYFLTILIVLVLIWLYTNKSGIKTLVWTDAFQSFFLISVLLISIYSIVSGLGETEGGIVTAFSNHPYTKLFDWNINSGTNFFKQFISGFLITVALVGLDQSMMQKTLTVKLQKDAQKNVLTFSFFIAFAQTLFLILGVLIYMYTEKMHISIQMENGKFLDTDKVFPMLTLNYFGKIGTIAFLIGVIASTFASIDSCIAALTTSFSYDIMKIEDKTASQKKQIKNGVLLGVNLVMFIIVMAFWNSQGAIIYSIFKIAGYTYGPLLGIFLLGLFSKITLKEKWVPVMCVLAAVFTYFLNEYFIKFFDFDFGFMNILVNAFLTIFLLILIKKKNN